jgi:hypothetical protein
MLSDIEYILQNQHLPWSWPCVSGYNQSLTIQHIIDNPQIEWNFSMYSRNNLAFNQCNKYNIKHYHNNYYNRYYHNKIKEYIKSTNFIITDLTIIICQYFEYNVSV